MRKCGVRILVLPLTSCVTLGRLLNLSVLVSSLVKWPAQSLASVALGGMDERTSVGPTAQCLHPDRCLEACAAIFFLRGSAGVTMYREPRCLGGLTDLHRGPGEASQGRTLRRRGFPLGQERKSAVSGLGLRDPPALASLSGPGAGLHPQPPLVHPGLQRCHRG